MSPSFGNPVAGPIRPYGTPGSGFGVTAVFGALDASHSTPHMGIDLGDGKCGSPIYAMCAGTISFAGQINGVNVVRYRCKEFPEYEPALAHMDAIEVRVGVSFAEGALLGHVGRSGASACHLHGGMKRNGVEIDWWPLLRQNQEDDMDASFSPKPNRTVTVNKGARHRLAPTTADSTNIAIASDPGGPLGLPLMGTVVGEPVNGNAIWYAYWRPEVSKVYYLHTSTTGPETPWEASGFTQADLDKAREAGITAAAANALATT